MSNAFDDATQLSERSNEPHGKQGFTMPKLPERLGIEHHESTDVDGTVLGTHGMTAPVTTNAPTVTPTAAPTITVTPDTAAPTERMTSWQATTERQPAASEQVRRQPTTGTMPETLNTCMMPAAGADIGEFHDKFNALVENVSKVVVGKDGPIRQCITAMVVGGHVLLEDNPGTGKTQLARGLANSIDMSFKRIQFTPDLLPSDVVGVTYYDQKRSEFEYREGPVFASVVLADEINRASPKTQSALLEVMEEAMVTVDGVRHPAGRPFMVIATQNPIEQAGTYKLPEAQLDRFLMKTSVGYPDRAAASQILLGASQPDRSKSLTAVISQQAVSEMSDLVKENYIDPTIVDYVQDLAEATRQDKDTAIGVSTRGAIAMVRAVRVWAAAHGRNFVMPDDVKDLAAPVWTHRIIMAPTAEFAGSTASRVIARVLNSVAAPANRAQSGS